MPNVFQEIEGFFQTAEQDVAKLFAGGASSPVSQALGTLQTLLNDLEAAQTVVQPLLALYPPTAGFITLASTLEAQAQAYLTALKAWAASGGTGPVPAPTPATPPAS